MDRVRDHPMGLATAHFGVVDDSVGFGPVQERMDLALVATPVQYNGSAPRNTDISNALQNCLGPAYLPSYIASFEPDFILHFDSVQTRDAVMKLGFLHTTTATLSLSLWTPFYRNQTVTWDAKVLITVSQIPPNCCYMEYVTPVLAGCCDIRSTKFNKIKGTCQIVGYSSSVSAIPTSGTIAFRHRTPAATILKTYPVLLTARAAEVHIPSDQIAEHPLFKAFCEEYPQYHPSMLHTAFEFGVDPDVLYDFYVENAEEEDRLHGIVKDDDDQSGSDWSMDYDGFSCRMMDQYSPSDDLSDREPAEWRGANI